MSLTELFLNIALLGAEWVMWLLVGLSLVSIAITAERAIFFSARRVNTDRLAADLTPLLRSGNVQGALELVRKSKAVECVVLAAGLAEARRGMNAASEAMLSAKVRERLKMESKLSILATLGNNSPFIGLLGTVLGIIKASHDLTANQAAGGGASATSAVMGGIFEALVATAIGLFVAIPAVAAFNFFQRSVRVRSLQTDSMAHLVLSMFKSDKPSKSPKPGEAAKSPKAADATKPQQRAEV